ncbi:MAG: hypothetical protein HRU03_05805, partial [Nanoarchaeales archaeon]|nr:hypothetical protein [Nanoarchaeales archaeon]
FRVFFSPINYFLYGIYHNSRNKSSDLLVKNFKKFSEIDSKLIYDLLLKNYKIVNYTLIINDFL